jgi:hypothetical protein
MVVEYVNAMKEDGCSSNGRRERWGLKQSAASGCLYIP